MGMTRISQCIHTIISNTEGDMVFIGGVHGAGKTRFCQEASNLIGLPSYSASTLISDRKGMIFPASKNIQGIDENQLFLIYLR